MSEKIIPTALSFNTNRYPGIDVVKKPFKNTMVLDNEKYNYGDIFEINHPEPDRLYSWEKKGHVKGLFESKNGKDFLSLTKTLGDGILEKAKNGESVLIANYSNNGKLTDLVEIIGDKMTFIDRSGKVTDSVGSFAKAKLHNIIRGIKTV